MSPLFKANPGPYNLCMSTTHFHKYSGNGNDFIILELDFITSERVQKLCHRNLGIGADGVLLLTPSDKADIKMRIFNADGTEADMCGNGLRCVASFIDKKHSEPKEHYKVETKNAVYSVFKKNEKMNIEMNEMKEKNLYDLSSFTEFTQSFFINTGVPHLVFLTEDVKKIDIKERGSFYRYHSTFPKGTNVNFLEMRDRDKLEFYVRSYERGVEDETYSCGTGIVACAHALHEWFSMRGEMHFETKGGHHIVHINEKVMFSGEVFEVYKGETIL